MPPTPLSPFRRIGDVVYTSGHIGSRDGAIVADTITAQTEQLFANMRAVLASAGGDLSSIVKCTCILSDRADFAEFNRVYAAAFAGVQALPARTTIIAGMPNPAALVELEAVAHIPERS